MPYVVAGFLTESPRVLLRRALAASLLFLLPLLLWFILRRGLYVVEPGSNLLFLATVPCLIAGFLGVGLRIARRVRSRAFDLIDVFQWPLVAAATVAGSFFPLEAALAAVAVAWLEYLSVTIWASLYDGPPQDIEEAAAERGYGQGMARLASFGTLIVVLSAAAVYLTIAWQDPENETLQEVLRNRAGVQATVALFFAVAPVAFLWATAAPRFAARAAAARHGVYFSQLDASARLRRVTILLFERRGVVTEAHPQVEEVVAPGAQAEEIVQFAAALATGVTHPIASAVLEQARRDRIELPSAELVAFVEGGGAEGTVNGAHVLAGARAWLEARGVETKTLDQEWYRLGREGKHAMGVAVGGRLVGLIAVHDPLRRDIVRVTRVLRRMRLRPILITSAEHDAIAVQAEQAGFTEIIAGIAPEEKPERARRLHKDTIGLVAGIAHVDGPQVLLEGVDVPILLGHDGNELPEEVDAGVAGSKLLPVVHALVLSRAVSQAIGLNYFVATAWHLLAIPAAAVGLLSPAFAVAGMFLISLFPLLNACRFLRFDPERFIAWTLQR